MNDAVIKGFNDDDDCFEMSKLRDDFESSVFKINTTNRGNGKPASSFMISDEISTNCYSNEKQTAKIKQKLENIEIPEEAAEKNQQEIQINNENDEADIINREINYDEGKRSDRNDYTDPSSKSVLIIRFRKFFNRGGSDISFDGGGRSDREVFPTTWDLNDSSNITDPNSGYEKHHRKKKQQNRKSKLLSPFSALRKYFLKSLIPSKYPRFDESNNNINNNNNDVQDDGNNGISVENGISATCSVPAVNKFNFLLHKTNDAIVDENEFTKIRNNIKMPNYLLPSKIPMKIDSAYHHHHHRRLNSSDFSKLIIGPNKIIQTDRPQFTDGNDDNYQQMCCQAALVEDNDDKHWILSMMGKVSSDGVKLNYNDDDAKIITTDVDGFVSNLNKRTMKCEEPTITMNFAIEQQVLDEVGYDSLQLLNDDYLCISDLDEYLSDRYIDEYLKRRPDDDDSNKTKKNAEQTEEQQIPNESSPPIELKIRLTEGKRTTEIVVDDDRDCSKKDADTFVSSSRIPRSRNLKSQQTVANLLKDRRIRDDDKKSADGKVPANTDLKKKKKIGGRVYKDSAAAELGGDKKNANSNDQRNTLEAEDGAAAELGKNVTIEISKIPRFYGLNIIADTNFHPKPSRTLIGKYKTKIPILTNDNNNNNNNVSVTNVNHPNVHKLLPYFGKEHQTKILLPTTMAASAPRDLVELFDKLGPIAPKLIDRIQRPKPKLRLDGRKRFIRTNGRRNAANGSNAADKSNGRIITTERQTAAVEEIIGMALNTTQMIEI